MKLDDGLVFMSDTRTNSGVDNVSVYSKMTTWTTPGDRSLVLLSAGNLATTQSVVSVLDERSKIPEERHPTILEVPTMFQAARLVGDTLREVIETQHRDSGPTADATFNATLILGGQIKGMEPRLFLIYPEGNFIEAHDDTPFLQIGEVKYGRPILVRSYEPAMGFEEAVRLLLVSFDSTLKANLSVGLPIDLQTYKRDSFTLSEPRRFNADDPYYSAVSEGWGDALRSALTSLPDFTFP